VGGPAHGRPGGTQRLAFLTRLGEGLVPGPDTVYQEGDLVHMVVREDQLERAEAVLTVPPKAVHP